MSHFIRSVTKIVIGSSLVCMSMAISAAPEFSCPANYTGGGCDAIGKVKDCRVSNVCEEYYMSNTYQTPPYFRCIPTNNGGCKKGPPLAPKCVKKSK